jgi:hypothetical protein
MYDGYIEGIERKDKITGNSEFGGAQRHAWNGEGGINTLNLSDTFIQNILNSGTSRIAYPLGNNSGSQPFFYTSTSLRKGFLVRFLMLSLFVVCERET